ncbi:unnamed protein product [Penicillium manginii]
MTDKIRGRVNDSILLRFGSKRSRFGLRRVPLESGYFEAYNQANFHLIDLKKTIIHQITRNSIRLRDGTEHELDILVYATGFNAITGAFANIDWTGNNGVPLMGNSDPKKGDGEEAVWVDYRPRTNLGLIVPKSPNMFMILGPHQPLGYCGIFDDWWKQMAIHKSSQKKKQSMPGLSI